ncbi:PRC-barrel domain-containing protein [[Brevibacterium] frigoritolerans]|uniref:PRC-barrel domain-containing protein n=1 Tax=Peribacillus frigoritolerans TaxID=450367 RepID=A0A941J7W2_9BACI|nr:PRC-barrel domain-containing protein [Peribacillus frigoritolerans]
MRTFSLLKGMPVFTIKGERIGTVHDLSISEMGQVTAWSFISKHCSKELFI